jgi:hypothetical protein
MAITKIRNGNDISLSSAKYPHDKKYDATFLCSSSVYATYLDFKYVFNLYTENGLISTYETSPSVDGYGVFDANKIISNLLDTIEYSNSVGTFKMMQEYRVSVQEFYTSALQGSAVYFDKCQMSQRLTNYNESQYPFKWSDLDNKILSNGLNMDLVQDVSTSAMMCIQSTHPNPNAYYVVYEVLYLNGFKWQFTRELAGDYEFSAAEPLIDAALDSGNYIASGYKDLLTTALTTVGYRNASDVWTASILSVSGITDALLTNVTTPSEIWLYSPYHNTSKVHWTLTNCFDTTLHWLNQEDGYEFFNLNTRRKDTLISDRTIYNSNEKDTNLFSNNSKPNKRIIKDNSEFTFDLYTQFLTDNEIVYLESLFVSEKVYLDIDNLQIPVIITDKKKIVKDTNNKLFQYNINLLYAVN